MRVELTMSDLQSVVSVLSLQILENWRKRNIRQSVVSRYLISAGMVFVTFLVTPASRVRQNRQIQ